MNSLLSFAGVSCIPACTTDADQERMLRAAGTLAESLTVKQGYALIALLCRGSSADVERKLIRIGLWCRSHGRRDILSLLFPDPVNKALGIVSMATAEQLVELGNVLSGIKLAENEVREDVAILGRLRETDPCLQLIDHFRNDLALRLKALFVVYRQRSYKKAVAKAGKRCTVIETEYDDERYKLKHWCSVLDAFVRHGVYPSPYLRDMERKYDGIPWPQSCSTLLESYTPSPISVPGRSMTVPTILSELMDGDLKAADVVRLALNASSRYVRGLYLPRSSWFELAWSLLDRSQRTEVMAHDLSMFETRMNTPTSTPTPAVFT
jgi:hypothetical protein